MKKQKYTITPKVKNQHYKMAKLNKWIDIAILTNQGWTRYQLADKYNVTYESIRQTLKKIGNMTVQDLEDIRNSLD